MTERNTHGHRAWTGAEFRPSWQARLGTHSWQDTEDERIARLKPRHESAKTTFRNDLLASYLLPNQLRYKQLRPHRPVKRVETEKVITHVAIGRVQPGQIHLSTGPGRQSHRETRHYRTAESCHRDRTERNTHGHIARTSAKFRPSWQARSGTHSR